MWKLIPAAWREQWDKEVRNIHGESVFNITDTLFVEDMTEGKIIYHKNIDLHNLKESTSWENFVKCFEKYVALPIVRCPWGCCESLNKVNFIPYDIIVSHFIKKSIPM
jgi:hypothetical protein